MINNNSFEKVIAIERHSIEDARKIFEKFILEKDNRNKLLDFLCDSIVYAHDLESSNWNLNLDKNGRFIQFNVGHQYCIRINSRHLLVLCDRTTLKSTFESEQTQIEFLGYKGDQQIRSKNMNEVPNCLVTTKNNIGCLIPIDEVKVYSDYFKKSNRDFIDEAIKTLLTPNMKEAHSQGAIEYLRLHSAKVSQPSYYTDTYTLSDFLKKENSEFHKAKKLSKEERKQRVHNANPKPKQTTVNQTVFIRNQNIVVEVLERANGICERCKKKAPFQRDSDGSPYLEVHHKVPLAEGGDDTIGNAIALCPNCHRHAHLGKKTYILDKNL